MTEPASSSPTPPVDNSMGEVHGTAIQAGVVHGSITVHSVPAPSIPGWVSTALPVHQIDAHELGVHDVRSDPTLEGSLPYVSRDMDEELDRRLKAAAADSRGGLVLVTGASTAGKTRALVEALRRTLPDRMLVAPPEGTDLRHLPRLLGRVAENAPQGWVIWLDDLDRHLSASGLTPALVTDLGEAEAVVAATIRQERLRYLRPSGTDHASLDETGYPVLRTPPVRVKRLWSHRERERARSSGDERLVKAADDERFGVAEQLAAGPLLQQTWDDGPDSGHPRGYALVAAAVDLARIGWASPLTREQIYSAHTAYLPSPPPLPEENDQAWAWATRPLSGMAGLLVPTDHEGRRWRAFDYLETQAPVPDLIWHTALATAKTTDRFTIGLTAYNGARLDITDKAWRPLADEEFPFKVHDMGVRLEETGLSEEAEYWYRHAAENDHNDAMYDLALLLESTERLEEAEHWYHQAAESGSVKGMYGLALLLERTGRLEEAEHWYRETAMRDAIEAMYDLGALLERTGRFEEADEWYRQAAIHDVTEAFYNSRSLPERTDEQIFVGENGLMSAFDHRESDEEVEYPFEPAGTGVVSHRIPF
ncbi:tetratricopeptide repeat protein [Nocardiopsis alba]|uniref:tetratricopeptide repeat protein n=2 Tax=Nocardiopsis alba TaxID=53437 RepID=UPI0033F511FB